MAAVWLAPWRGCPTNSTRRPWCPGSPQNRHASESAVGDPPPPLYLHIACDGSGPIEGKKLRASELGLWFVEPSAGSSSSAEAGDDRSPAGAGYTNGFGGGGRGGGSGIGGIPQGEFQKGTPWSDIIVLTSIRNISMLCIKGNLLTSLDQSIDVTYPRFE